MFFFIKKKTLLCLASYASYLIIFIIDKSFK